MKLYNKYINEIELISVDFDVFNKKYKEIQVELYKILQPYLKLKYKKIDYKLLIPTNTFSDDELFSEVMKYSPDNIRLPKTSDIDKMIHLEILKRFGSYKDFAKNFNKDTIVETTSWSDEKIFEILTQMTNEGIIINSKTTKRQYKGLNDAILKAGGLNKVKIKHFLNYKGDIPDDEMKWIIDISEGKTKTSAKINDEIINSAKLILKQRFTRAS
jgi:hypothetical protein